MTFTRWSDIRDEHIERAGPEEFEAGKEQMLAEARGWRLAPPRSCPPCLEGTVQWTRSAWLWISAAHYHVVDDDRGIPHAHYDLVAMPEVDGPVSSAVQ